MLGGVGELGRVGGLGGVGGLEELGALGGVCGVEGVCGVQWVVQSILSFAFSSTPFISPPGSSGKVKRIFLCVWEENQQSQVSFPEVNIL